MGALSVLLHGLVLLDRRVHEVAVVGPIDVVGDRVLVRPIDLAGLAALHRVDGRVRVGQILARFGVDEATAEHDDRFVRRLVLGVAIDRLERRCCRMVQVVVARTAEAASRCLEPDRERLAKLNLANVYLASARRLSLRQRIAQPVGLALGLGGLRLNSLGLGRLSRCRCLVVGLYSGVSEPQPVTAIAATARMAMLWGMMLSLC